MICSSREAAMQIGAGDSPFGGAQCSHSRLGVMDGQGDAAIGKSIAPAHTVMMLVTIVIVRFTP